MRYAKPAVVAFTPRVTAKAAVTASTASTAKHEVRIRPTFSGFPSATVLTRLCGRLAHETESDVADAKSRTVIAVSRRHALESGALIPTAAANDRQTRRKTVKRVHELPVRS